MDDTLNAHLVVGIFCSEDIVFCGGHRSGATGTDYLLQTSVDGRILPRRLDDLYRDISQKESSFPCCKSSASCDG